VIAGLLDRLAELASPWGYVIVGMLTLLEASATWTGRASAVLLALAIVVAAVMVAACLLTVAFRRLARLANVAVEGRGCHRRDHCGHPAGSGPAESRGPLAHRRPRGVCPGGAVVRRRGRATEVAASLHWRDTDEPLPAKVIQDA
jgi:hypothetical protein